LFTSKGFNVKKREYDGTLNKENRSLEDFFLCSAPTTDLSLEDWWNTSLAGLSKENRRSKAAILIWKARNHQVFDHLLLTPLQVLLEIKKEIALRKRARGEEEPFKFL